ncbi:MAG TPA: nucleotidyltransferase family protein [Pyrinomonadaceae bacterium]|nr:nucleotidyltransferase family protein [Pyrinomonadaceae bacterium]
MGRVEAVLLAAGRSRRMGAFKPLLPFGAKSVVETCVDNLLAGGARRVVVVVGHRAEDVRRELLTRQEVLTVFNEEAESEMGVSIARGVEAVGGDARSVLIALADQPAVPPRVIDSVIAAWRERGAPLVVPTYEGRGGHPVLVDLRLRRELSSLPPERGLRALFDARRGEVLRLPVDSPYIVRDMDTWDEYAALYEEVFGRPPEASAPGGE